MIDGKLSFTVIIVTLNSGDRLSKTVESILRQDYDNYEILIKDGGSTDGSIEKIEAMKRDNIRIVRKSDKGIYDAMNQAAELACGLYLIYMNAGDCFFSNDLLSNVAKKNLPDRNVIAYGNTFFCSSQSLSIAPPAITGSVCYRNIPCHQAIFYSKDTLTERGFDTSLKIRADFEHFAFSYFVAKREFVNLHMTICYYEGGGFSESKENRRRDREEYRIAVRRHIPLKNRFLYRATLILTLHRLRGFLAKSPLFAKMYQSLKAAWYKKKGA